MEEGKKVVSADTACHPVDKCDAIRLALHISIQRVGKYHGEVTRLIVCWWRGGYTLGHLEDLLAAIVVVVGVVVAVAVCEDQ